jgi:hypothetical protein
MLSALLLSVVVAPAQQSDQAFFAILAETKVGRMAGMPLMDLSELPPGIKLPKEAMMFAGVPTRILNVRLWSPSIAPAGATAHVTPPPGLKQGNKLDLELYRPQASDTTGGPVKGFDPDSNPEFTVKIYWGSSETVKAGQPRVITWGGLTDEQKAVMKEQARQAQANTSHFYKAGWTTGFWPTEKQKGEIAKDASLVGKYSLTTSYTGNVEIEAPSHVTFLEAIGITSPNLEKTIDLKKSMPFAWKEVPNCLGFYASIFTIEGKNTLIIWSSSEVFNEGLMGDMGFLQMAQVRDYVAQTVFMPGNATKVTVPAGIFQNGDAVMMQMAGYGPGAALEAAQPLPRIQTKTSLMLMLGGKQMRG